MQRRRWWWLFWAFWCKLYYLHPTYSSLCLFYPHLISLNPYIHIRNPNPKTNNSQPSPLEFQQTEP
ncbi:hypothetical protein HanIR_Chr11g0513761 [Helianthus annuus]|nr:hypothetical protein HanIR_Chr11g0513761 [Helianthus annuus]